jgi:hypothetical protein
VDTAAFLICSERLGQQITEAHLGCLIVLRRVLIHAFPFQFPWRGCWRRSGDREFLTCRRDTLGTLRWGTASSFTFWRGRRIQNGHTLLTILAALLGTIVRALVHFDG